MTTGKFGLLRNRNLAGTQLLENNLTDQAKVVVDYLPVIRALTLEFAVDTVPKPGTVAQMTELMASQGYRSPDKGIHGKD